MSKEDGGVGFGSLDAMNKALLYKWRWRALDKPNSLWVNVLEAIHGKGCFYNLVAKNKGLWYDIVYTVKDCHASSEIHPNTITRKVGNGLHTKFWTDTWCGNETLASKIPRLAALDMDKNCSVSDTRLNNEWNWNWRRPIRTSREQDQLNLLITNLPNELASEENDTWRWNLNGKVDFNIAQIRHKIDHHCLPIDSKFKTRWNQYVPKKVNLFIWRLRWNCIPTNVNLFARGIDVTTFRCIQCQNGVETINHLFNRCKVYSDTKLLLCQWIRLTIPDGPPEDTIKWCDNLGLSSKHRTRLEAILFTYWWYSWKVRNNLLHNNVQENSLEIFNAIVSFTYLWIHNRDKKDVTTWEEWIVTPLKPAS